MRITQRTIFIYRTILLFFVMVSVSLLLLSSCKAPSAGKAVFGEGCTSNADCTDANSACTETDPRVCAQDTDSDGAADVDDVDDDNDGILDAVPDNCPLVGTSNQADFDIDGVGDACDNCVNDYNPGQEIHVNSEGAGDACYDNDGDGFLDFVNDNCPNVNNPSQADTDANGLGDACNDAEDSDGDEWADNLDNCAEDLAKVGPGACGCGVADTDTDSDGDADCADGCPNDSGKSDPGVCDCGVADDDIDADAVPDCIDDCPNDATNSCSPVTECLSANDCDDGDASTIDSCDAFGECQHVPESSGEATGDGGEGGEEDPCADVVCPENQVCQEGTCVADFCPDDPAKSGPGACGCGVADTDTDSDGDADCADGCPNDSGKSDPGVCDCGVADDDTDADAVPDCIDACPNDFGKSISDIDNLCGGLGAGCTDSSECVSNTCIESECGHPLDILNSELSALLDEFQNPNNTIEDKVSIIARIKVVLDKYFEKPYAGPRLR